MATNKWKKVKVKVKGKLVERWTDGKSYRIAEPNGQSLRRAVESTHKVGTYNVGRTKRWDGKKWVKVNVTHAGQKATLNGKPVVADGKGNWVKPAPHSVSGYGAKQGTYKKGEKAASKPAVGRNWSNPHGQVSDKPSTGDRSTWSNKPTTSASSSSSSSRSTSSSSSSGVARPARKAQSSDMDANYAAFAKAHPKLAAKVKPGQAGYDAIQKALGKSSGSSERGTSSSSSTSSSRDGVKGTGPIADGAAYAEQLRASRSRGTKGVGPLRNGDDYSDAVEGSRRQGTSGVGPVRSGSAYASDIAKSGVRRGIRAGQAADKSNQPTQASKHYQSGNTFGAYDGGANPQRGSQSQFAPKNKSLKDALKEITSKLKRGRANPYN